MKTATGRGWKKGIKYICEVKVYEGLTSVVLNTKARRERSWDNWT